MPIELNESERSLPARKCAEPYKLQVITPHSFSKKKKKIEWNTFDPKLRKNMYL
jgi:hypothetical protein